MKDLSVWAEVDLGAIAHNCKEVRRIISSSTKFMAVVKADAYGHGAVMVSRAVLRSGADFLGVARVEEAVELRENKVEAPILVLGYVPPSCLKTALKYDITCTIFSKEQAEIFSSMLKGSIFLKSHIKVDTGMGRLGILATAPGQIEKAVDEIVCIVNLPGLEVEGIYTHFARADSDEAYTLLQLNRFLKLLDVLEKKGVSFPLRHACNSAALVHFPEAHLDMVRPGIMLYGVYPSKKSKSRINLVQAMSLKSKVVMVKEVPAGFNVSYGSTYTTSEPTRLATVSVGYGDGYPRSLSSRGQMLIRGKRVRVAGRICMDYTVVDVGREKVRCGDEVVVFGGKGEGRIGVEEIADLCNTIGYEILTGITKRVKRIYKGEGD